MIVCRGLTRRFGATTAIEALDFTVERGEIVGFLGPNGAGKTTTLRILSGFLPATSGAASVAGHDVLRDSLAARRKLGYLPESVPLYLEHRVDEMLRFQARLHGMSAKRTKERIPAVLDRVGILDRARQPIGQLSRGLRQRVGLAVALLPEPEVLLLDEPTSGLDPLQRVEVRDLVKELSAEHTVLLSSHILPEIEATCPRVIVLHKGRIAADGTHAELVRQLGSPSHVRLEAVVPAGAAEARRLIEQLPGVQSVVPRGRLGIHEGFDVICSEDLREDIGALAALKGWTLRELSWRQPTLEELFARVALDLGGGERAPAAPAAAPSESTPTSSAGPSLTGAVPLTIATPTTIAAKPVPSAPRVGGMRTLSPFERPFSEKRGESKPSSDDPSRE